MKKFKKTFALIGIVLLVGLYLSTLIFAFIDTSTSLMYFKTSIAATIFFPIILYVMTLFHNYKQPSDNENEEEL